MKKIAIIFILVLLPLLLTSCVPIGGSAAPAEGTTTTLATRIASLEGQLTSALARVAALEARPAATSGGATAADIDTLNKKITELKTSYASDIETLNKKITDLQAKDTALDTRISQWTNPVPGQTPPPSGAVTGQITYSIIAPTDYNNRIFSGPASQTLPLMTIKIYNGMASSQFIRPIITLNTTNYTNAGAWGSPGICNCVAVPANYCMRFPYVQGSPIVFTPTALPDGSVTTVMNYASSGGVNGTGALLLGPGTSVDIYLEITNFKTANSAMWNITVSGTNSPLQ